MRPTGATNTSEENALADQLEERGVGRRLFLWRVLFCGNELGQRLPALWCIGAAFSSASGQPELTSAAFDPSDASGIHYTSKRAYPMQTSGSTDFASATDLEHVER